MKHFSTLILVLFFSAFTEAQNTGFTENYILSKKSINSSLSGNSKMISIVAINQNGSKNSLGGLQNYYFSADLPFLEKSGLSIQYSDFSYNLVKARSVSLGFANHFKIDENKSFSIGINSGIVKNSFDFKSDFGLATKAQMDSGALNDGKTSYSPNGTSSFAFEKFTENQYLLGAGIYLNLDKWHVGFSVPNVIKNKIPDYNNPNNEITLERPAFLSVEKDININKKLSLTAGSLYRFSKINASQKGLDLQGSIWLNKKYSLGLWYQRIGGKNIINTPKPIVATTEMILKKIRLGYSYNFNKSPNAYTTVKQQIMFRIDVDYLKDKTQK